MGGTGNLNAGHLFLGADPQVHLVVAPEIRTDGRIVTLTEGLAGKRTDLANGRPEGLFRLVVGCREIPHPACVGDGRAQRRLAEPHHGPAEDGVLDAEHFGDTGPDHGRLSLCHFVHRTHRALSKGRKSRVPELTQASEFVERRVTKSAISRFCANGRALNTVEARGDSSGLSGFRILCYRHGN